MANLKNITDLPMAESSEGLNLIVNDNGAAKQISANAVGVKSWNDLEDKPFIYDLVVSTEVNNDGRTNLIYGNYDKLIEKFNAKVPIFSKFFCSYGAPDDYYNDIGTMEAQYIKTNEFEVPDLPAESLCFINNENSYMWIVTPDDSVVYFNYS